MLQSRRSNIAPVGTHVFTIRYMLGFIWHATMETMSYPSSLSENTEIHFQKHYIRGIQWKARMTAPASTTKQDSLSIACCNTTDCILLFKWTFLGWWLTRVRNFNSVAPRCNCSQTNGTTYSVMEGSRQVSTRRNLVYCIVCKWYK